MDFLREKYDDTHCLVGSLPKASNFQRKPKNTAEQYFTGQFHFLMPKTASGTEVKPLDLSTYNESHKANHCHSCIHHM